MNHNPHNLKEGEHCILDDGYANRSEVVIFRFTPNEMFATVYSAMEVGGDMWQTMTYRLTPIKKT